METLQSLDLDGLDGILSSSDKQRSRSVRSKAMLGAPFVGLAVIMLFFLLKHPSSPLASPEAATQPLAKVATEAAKILPQTAAAQPTVKDEQVVAAMADTSSMPATGASVSASPAQPQQDSTAQPSMVQAQPDVPMLPAESTAAGNANGTADNAPFTVYFKYKSNAPIRLSDAETSRLIAVAKDCPKRIRITGHTCHLGSVAANLRLGQKRAEAVKKWLVAGGIDAGRIDTASEGENTPATSNATASELAANRRAVLECADQ